MIKQLWNGMLISFAMYSKVPVPTTEWSEDNMKYSMCFFPLVGVVIGVLMYIWYLFSGYMGFGTNFAAAVYLLIPVVVSGGIHLDGLLDTADAVSSWQPMERRLEILKDSNSGAFAVIWGVCYFVLAFGVFSELTIQTVFHGSGRAGLIIICLGFILSRSLSGLSVVSFRKARKTGLAVAFANPAQKQVVKWTMLVCILASSLLMLVVDWRLGLAALAGAFGVFAYYRYMSYKKFGGITGDLCGFFTQVSELAMALLVVLVMAFL